MKSNDELRRLVRVLPEEVAAVKANRKPARHHRKLAAALVLSEAEAIADPDRFAGSEDEEFVATLLDKWVQRYFDAGKAATAVKAEEGSRRGNRKLAVRSFRRGAAVVAALRQLDYKYPGKFWQGGRFLLTNAARQLETDVRHEAQSFALFREVLDEVAPDDEVEWNAINFSRWASKLKPTWPRSSGVDHPDADVRRCREAKAGRADKQRALMREAAEEFARRRA